MRTRISIWNFVSPYVRSYVRHHLNSLSMDKSIPTKYLYLIHNISLQSHKYDKCFVWQTKFINYIVIIIISFDLNIYIYVYIYIYIYIYVFVGPLNSVSLYIRRCKVGVLECMRSKVGAIYSGYRAGISADTQPTYDDSVGQGQHR